MAKRRRIETTQRPEAAPDSVLRALLDAPNDDEPLTPVDEEALSEAYDELRRGLGVPEAEVRRRLGLE
ncbi:MAG: hypothetical protein IT340_08390 [Chloroflexi bacterium]|nr:hypothetical protein [Chloroflexota bacterium]